MLFRSPFEYRSGVASWSLAVTIPAGSLVHHPMTDWGGKTLSLNMYKCGDALPRPHYLSLYPIASAQPDFHRPECFGAVRFE